MNWWLDRRVTLPGKVQQRWGQPYLFIGKARMRQHPKVVYVRTLVPRRAQSERARLCMLAQLPGILE